MDAKGHETITAAFIGLDLDARVLPEPPLNGENVPFVTIDTPDYIPPESVLNALARSGLLQRPGTSDDFRKDPELRIISAVPGAATFEDMTRKPRR